MEEYKYVYIPSKFRTLIFTMARRRYRRYRRRSGRWSANIQEVSNLVGAPPGQFYTNETILLNPPQSPSLVTQTYTVKNIEISFNIDNESNSSGSLQSIEAISAYIMYVPQGMTVTIDYNLQHPEYIMAYKYLGSPAYDFNGQQYQPFKVRTRLARKLQSGDNVVLFLKGINQSGTDTIPLRISGLVRWWTKAN